MSEPRPVCWVDGRLQPADAPALRADDSAAHDGRGCYTSVRIRAGAARWPDRHARRLVRDGCALGLPPADPRRLERAIDELAHAAFGGGDGVVRLQLSADADGALHVVGTARGLGSDPPRWRAQSAPRPHPGPDGGPPGAKLTNRLALTLAADAARADGADEALLFDRAGRLVEGARSNVIVERANGALGTPPLERGAVAGLALEVLRERLPALRSHDVSRRGLDAARGVAVVNAVRGARALVALDAAELGAESGALAARLAAILNDD